jgi:ABC-type spermidine/putrescine transport system permease subunit II
MSRRPANLACIIYLVAIYGFLYLPIAVLVIYSFNDTRYSSNWQGFTFKWYLALRDNRMLLDSLFNSLLVALLSSTIATAIGTLAAVAFQRYRFPGRKLLYGLLFVVIGQRLQCALPLGHHRHRRQRLHDRRQPDPKLARPLAPRV